MKRLYPILLLLATLAGAIATFQGAYGYFRTAELRQAQARLSLYRSTVAAELMRFSHLTFVLARDTYVIEAARGGDTGPLNRRLADFAQSAGIDAIYLMDAGGMTRAASNAGTSASFVGQDYSFRPYFRTAITGQRGEFYGVGATTGVAGYFFADPVRDATGRVLGVIAIKIDLAGLTSSWRDAGERVLLANADGVVLLASLADWQYRTLRPLTPNQRTRIDQTRQFADQPLTALDWRAKGGMQAEIDGQSFLYLHTNALPNAWSLHYFASDAQAVTRAWLATGAVLLIAGAVLILVQVQRTQRIGAQLRRSENEEAQLRAANERLAIEIDERRTAELRLQRTQAQLERAGRLAALGQLAASVTHELGQPIAAMRNHLAAAEIQGQSSPLTTRLQGLVDRMEGITRQLKFFARKGRDDFEEVDLRDAMRAALELVDPDLTTHAIRVTTDWPDAPVMLSCNRLRIEQVMTNLLRNAIDAMAEATHPALHLCIGEDEDGPWFSVTDTGHGLGERDLEELSEPFMTTRQSGRGMGLGLAISTAIVEDHHGRMNAENHADGGALFVVRFPTPERAGTTPEKPNEAQP